MWKAPNTAMPPSGTAFVIGAGGWIFPAVCWLVAPIRQPHASPSPWRSPHCRRWIVQDAAIVAKLWPQKLFFTIQKYASIGRMI